MKKLFFFALQAALINICITSYSQEVNVTYQATITNEVGNSLPNTYIKIFSPDELAAVDSMFSNEEGKINCLLPFTIASEINPYSLKSKNSCLIKKISPNIISGENKQLQIEYTYPTEASIIFIDIQGIQHHNKSKIAPGMYMYYLLFEDGRQTELNKLIVGESMTINVTLNNILQDTKTKKNQAKDFEDGDAFYSEIFKDGYITKRDTITISSSVIEKSYSLVKAELPTAAFNHSGDQICGEALLFSASESKGTTDEELVYHWDFGDGLSGGSARTTHIYNLPGTYDVRLTVSGNYGALSTITKSITIAEGGTASSNTGVLSIYLSDQELDPLEGVTAEVVEADKTGSSDMEGIVSLEQLPVGIPLHVKLTKENYVTQIIELTIPTESESAVSLASLKERLPSTTLYNAEFGGEVSGEDGSLVELPILPFKDEDGNVVRGNVEVNITPVDVAFEAEGFPGTFSGYNENGDEGVLLSYGVSEYHFEQNGEKLQLAEGKKATVYIPIYTSGATIGNEIPLWSVNEENGQWTQEGYGMVVESASSPTGLALKSEVSHFSWFNCDDFENGRNVIGRCKAGLVLTGSPIPEFVDCWVSGARVRVLPGGGKSKKTISSKENILATRDTILPVFEVRSYMPSDGYTLLMPYSQDVLLYGIAFDEAGNKYSGSYTLLAGDNTGNFEIELSIADAPDTIELEIPFSLNEMLYENSRDVYKTQISEAGIYTALFSRGSFPRLYGVFVITQNNQSILRAETNDDFHFLNLETGTAIIAVHPGETDHGEYNLAMHKTSVSNMSASDSISNIMNDDNLYSLYKIQFTEDKLVCLKYYISGSSSAQCDIKILNHSFSEIFSNDVESSIKYKVFECEKDSAYYICTNKAYSDTEYTLISSEKVIKELQYGDHIKDTLEFSNDIDFFHFNGQAGDVITINGFRSSSNGLSNGVITLKSPEGIEIVSRELYSNNYEDNEILYELPTSGEYSIKVMSDIYNTGSYEIILDKIIPIALEMNSLTELNLIEDETTYLEFEVAQDTLCHISSFGIDVSGEFIIYSENGTKITEEGEQIDFIPEYSASSYETFNNYLSEGKYYIYMHSSGTGTAFINMQLPIELVFNNKNKASLIGSIDHPKHVNTYYLKASPDDGVHAQIKKAGTADFPENVSLRFNTLNNEGDYFRTRVYDDISVSLSESTLAESGAKMEGESHDTIWVIQVKGETAGSYNIDVHHVPASHNIIVDDDFYDYPDATTSSIVAACLAAQDNCNISLGNGDYHVFFKTYIEADSVRINGQSLEGVRILDEYNYSSYPSLSFSGDACELNNMTLSNGQNAGNLIGFNASNFRMEDILFTALPGYEQAYGGIKGEGDSIVIRRVELDSTRFGFDFTSSDNCILEDCKLVTDAKVIEWSGTNNIFRNNDITITEGGDALDIKSDDEGNTIIEDNTILIKSSSGSGSGIISLTQTADIGNTHTSYVRNNTIRSNASLKAFAAGNGNPPSKIIIENNRYHCTHSSGGEAFRLFPSRSNAYSDIIVRNNIFDGLASEYVLDINSASLLTGDSRFMVCNNSFRMTENAETDAGNSFINIYTGSYDFNDTIQFYFINNIVQGNGITNFAHCDYNVLFYSDYNVRYSFSSLTSGGLSLIGTSNDITTDPKFINSELQIDPTSPAVDEGADWTLYEEIPEVDIIGTVRSVGEVDIGAWER